jgi:Cu(I)/Ag(I) efflux system membrane protein CusA/SilA
LPIVFGLIFVLLYMLFQSTTEAIVLILPTVYGMTGGLLLQCVMGFNHGDLSSRSSKSSNRRWRSDPSKRRGGGIGGAVQRLRPKLMTLAVVMLSLAPILWESGIGSDVMKPIAVPIVGGMITSTIHVLILVPVFFATMKERALSRSDRDRNDSSISRSQ